jgi:hypothetical protein
MTPIINEFGKPFPAGAGREAPVVAAAEACYNTFPLTGPQACPLLKF